MTNDTPLFPNLREPAAAFDHARRVDEALDPQDLTPADLLAGLGVKDPEALLEAFPGGTLAGATRARLRELLGAKVGRAVFCALGLASKLTATTPGTYLKPRDVWEALRDIREHKKEHFVVFYLDTRNKEIKRDIVSIGTLNYNLVHPREVFEPAVRNLAASVVVAHNHPSGCLEPSNEDLSLTKRLAQAGKLLGIELLDHVIVTSEGFMSFKQKGLI